MRLGFAGKVLGRSQLKPYDTRRWQNEPHLSVSLAYLRDIFIYLRRQNIKMYRMAADLAPYVTHPDMPQFHNQIGECATELAAVGEMARSDGLRLSFHAKMSTVLNSPDADLTARSIADLTAQTQILDAMQLGALAVIVVHVGGIYDDKKAAMRRFVEHYRALSAETRARLVLEHDDKRFSVADILWINEQCGIPLVFDHLHFLNFNPEQLPLTRALSSCLQTWAADVTPKIHFSSPRTAMHIIEHKDEATGKTIRVTRPPAWVYHADYINPFEFIDFLRKARAAFSHDFDVMLETRAKDLALLRLREDLGKYANGQFGKSAD